METATFFLLYPAVFIAGAILTQLIGNADRPMHEGFLAWIFLPIGLLACLSALGTEGLHGVKAAAHDFFETLLNFKLTSPKPKNSNAHRMKGDLV